MQVFGIFCWSGKTTIEVNNEGIQPGIGILDAADAFKPHFFDKSILKSLVCALNATFSLRAVGAYQLDPQFGKHPAELSDSSCGSATIIDPENAVLIAVERQWFAMLFKIRAGGHHVIKG
ncbi:Uncharacterised protein [Klebsiella pneumoniae]|nr:hypothetical protein HR38_28565 [Klebsiella michiganensis]VGF73795.1 Uncharacterised protein [Klebsiella pneumoniae]VGJ07323.1 Uncharacterised protein [Klebsiella pneumoniae]